MGNGNNNWFGDILTGFLGFLLAIPLFFFAHRQLPALDLPFRIDRILLFIVLIVLLMLVLRLFKTVIAIGFFAVLIWLGYGTYTGGYGFADLYKDARAFIYTFQNDPNIEKLAFTKITEKESGGILHSSGL